MTTQDPWLVFWQRITGRKRRKPKHPADKAIALLEEAIARFERLDAYADGDVFQGWSCAHSMADDCRLAIEELRKAGLSKKG